jgi:bis(5'-nucleosyl)-tetraphosphatase (symmetrical)
MQRIFVGDVQGCAEELDLLLERAKAAYGRRFELWMVGDLINRGPSSLRVLERIHGFVERGRARVVLGNHEVGLLAIAAGARKAGRTDTAALEVLEHRDGDAWIAWLRSLPLAIEGTLGETPFVMVHAAVDPKWGLPHLLREARRVEKRLARGGLDGLREFLERDPSRRSLEALGRLTRCRSVDPDGSWSEALPNPRQGREAWHQAWSRAGHSYGVVYGHWAMQGLHVEPGLRGLDTGCVHHGRGRDGFLSAWLPDERRKDPFAVPDDRVWQVRGLRRYLPVTPGTN